MLSDILSIMEQTNCGENWKMAGKGQEINKGISSQRISGNPEIYTVDSCYLRFGYLEYPLSSR